MLNSSGEPTIFSNSLSYQESIQYFTIKYTVSGGFTVDVLFQVKFSSLPSLLSIIIMKELEFFKCQVFCLSFERTMWFLSFSLLICCIILIKFCTLNQLCIPALNPTWSWYIIFFICYWIQSDGIVFEDFHIHKRYWSVVFFFLWYRYLMGVLLSKPKLRNDFRESVSGQRKNFKSLVSWWEFWMQGFEFLAEHNLETRWKDHKVSVEELLFLPLSFAKCVTWSKLPRISWTLLNSEY